MHLKTKVPKPQKPVVLFYLIAMALLLVLNFFLIPSTKTQTITEVPYSTLLKMLGENKVTVV